MGVDFPTVDNSPHRIHKLLLSNGIFIVESLTGLERLRDAGEFEFFSVPLRIEAEASPVRAFAVTEERRP